LASVLAGLRCDVVADDQSATAVERHPAALEEDTENEGRLQHGCQHRLTRRNMGREVGVTLSRPAQALGGAAVGERSLDALKEMGHGRTPREESVLRRL
jgi:hypothetical protein